MNTPLQISTQTVTTDWAALYQAYQTEASCPDITFHQITPQRAVFRGLAQNLADIAQQIKQSGCTPHTVVIYTDVLIISAIEWTFRSPVLVIYARRVEVTGAATFLFTADVPRASLIFYRAEWTGKLKISITGKPEKGVTLTTPPGAQPGVHLRFANGTITSTDMDYKQGIGVEVDEQMDIYLSNLFIMASLLYSDQPSIALSLLLWIKDWTAFPLGMELLFYRSLSLSIQLQAEIDASLRNSRFIPYLSQNVYVEQANAFIREITSYEDKYMHLFTVAALTQQNIDMVRSMVNISQSEKNYIKLLLQQATDNYNNAQEAVKLARANFGKQERIVKDLAIDFEEKGIPQYQREQILKAVLSLLTAVVQFGSGIASMAVGDPTGGGKAVDGAINATENVAKAADTAKDVAEKAKEAADTMKKLKELIKILKSLYELSNKVATFINDLQKAINEKEIINKTETLTGNASLNIIDAWDAYILQVDNMMADPVSKNIGYAAEYKEALDILAIYGKSMCKAELAVIKTSQEMIAIAFQLAYAKEKEAELNKLVASLQAGQEMPLKLMQQLCQKYLDSKISLFCALKSYQSSYFYWSFRESSIHPRIASRISLLDTDLQEMTKVAMDAQHALELFNPQPQDLKNGIYEITDPAIIASLRRERKAVFTLPLEAEELEGFERVRLDTIRIWLEGVKFTTTDHKVQNKNEDITRHQVQIKIENTGNYADRYKGKPYQFTSRPLLRSFQYEVTDKEKDSAYMFDNGSYGLVRVDGNVNAEVAYAYFHPTPFSEWMIDLNPSKDNQRINSDIDLTDVSKIVFYFNGSTIPGAIST